MKRGPVALVLAPGAPPMLARLDLDARAASTELHQIIGGDLETIGGGDWCAYLDEEGRRHQRPDNAVADTLARALGWQPAYPEDHLCGVVVFLGRARDRETDVPERLLRCFGMDADDADAVPQEKARLRLRVYVDGDIADETWLPDPHNPDGGKKVGDRHKAITDAAERDGKLWLIEFYDPDEPDETAAYRRMGTDTRMMTMPVIVSGSPLTAQVVIGGGPPPHTAN
jgi:hypothetical protein